MAVCFFNRDYEKKYYCEYKLKDDFFEIIVDYDITDEIETVNGGKLFCVDTEFNKRDILIIDYDNKKNYLLKDASYLKHTWVGGTPDDGTKTKFFANNVFENESYEKLSQLLNTPKIKKVRLYSKSINEFIGYPSLKYIDKTEKLIVELDKYKRPNREEIIYNNIRSVSVSDFWNSNFNGKTNKMQIEFNGYIEIELFKREHGEQKIRI